MSDVLASGKFPSSDRSQFYSAAIHETFNRCDCPGYKFRSKCKHVDALKDFLDLQNSTESVE